MSPALSNEQRAQLYTLFKKYAAAVCMDTHSDLPPANVPPMRIDTSNKSPVCQKARPIPVAAKQFAEDEIKAMLKAGFIVRVFDSAWASPVHIVPKRGSKKWRMCIDYRQVNELTVPFAGSVPYIDELICAVRGKAWLSTFDLASAYMQCPVAEEDQVKTTFVTHMGTFMYTRVPFGLRNAVQYYCACISQVLRPVAVESEDALLDSYLDDVIVGAKTFERHCELIADFLACCCANNCKISLEKSFVGGAQVSYLGYLVNQHYCEADPDRLQGLRDMSHPTSIKTLRSFLGAINYFAPMLPGIRTITEPLQECLRGGITVTKKDGSQTTRPVFQWTKEMAFAFSEVKKMLWHHLVLYLPDPNVPFILYSDASLVASGAALVQRDEHGDLQPVAFYSKTFKPAERNYSTQHRELLAMLHALRRSRNLLLGGAHITAYTDHKANKTILTTKTQTDCS